MSVRPLVYVVEDEEPVRGALRVLLRGSGFAVATCASVPMTGRDESAHADRLDNVLVVAKSFDASRLLEILQSIRPPA